MSKSTYIRLLIVIPVLAFVAAATLVGDLAVLAQNTNSSTTEETSVQDASQANDTVASPRPRGRRRRNSRRATALPANFSVQDDTGASSPGAQEDLSGSWTGRVRITGGHEMSGEATLTITGNSFTLALADGSMSHTGRVFAVTTRGYTGASFFFTDLPDSATSTPIVAATRVRRTGNRINITPVPGTRTRMTFNGRSSG